MRTTTSDGTTPVTRLRAALRHREAATVAALLATVPVGIAVAEDLPLRASAGRVLPVYLCADSFAADAPAGELVLLLPQELLALLSRLDVEGVRFDPALPDPVTLPRNVLQQLLAPGEPATPGG